MTLNAADCGIFLIHPTAPPLSSPLFHLAQNHGYLCQWKVRPTVFKIIKLQEYRYFHDLPDQYQNRLWYYFTSLHCWYLDRCEIWIIHEFHCSYQYLPYQLNLMLHQYLKESKICWLTRFVGINYGLYYIVLGLCRQNRYWTYYFFLEKVNVFYTCPVEIV